MAALQTAFHGIAISVNKRNDLARSLFCDPSRSENPLKLGIYQSRIRATRADLHSQGSHGDNPRANFEVLKENLAEIAALESVKNLLFWDQQVKMPAKGVAARGAQLAAVARALHAKRTDAQLGSCIDQLHSGQDLADAGLSVAEIATVREAARDFQRSVKVPADLEAEVATLGSRGSQVWQLSKKEGRFDLFAPVLQEWVDLQQKMAAAVEPNLPPYDYCLDKFEPGMTSAKLDAVFKQLKEPLIRLVADVKEAGVTIDRSFLKSRDLFSGQFSKETQLRLARRFAEEIGFNFECGRLDESVHPFTMGVASPDDVRITSKFDETDLTSGIRATLHEAGHGLYEQGISAEFSTLGLPAYKARSLGLHESQSLLWERQVGMSLPFWEHYWPIVLRSFSSLPKSSADQFYRVINEVKPNLIRIEADELTYPLHIIVRYEIERSLIEGTLDVNDVPAVWAEKMEHYLAVVPANDSEGCLQDIHWSAGLIGYFPTYTLGALYASQLFEAAEKAIPSLQSDIKKGMFQGLRQWLRVNVHEAGSLLPTADNIVEQVTGKGLDPSCFLGYLEKKYSDLYGLSNSKIAISVAAK